MTIVAIDDDERGQIADAIERALLASLSRSNTQAVNDTFVLASRDENGALAGGVTGSTSYGWLLIKTLWVDETMRGTGLGKQLVLEAESRGRKLGCHNVWLDTSSVSAHSFYSHLGYNDFGALENKKHQVPVGHCRWFMKKAL